MLCVFSRKRVNVVNMADDDLLVTISGAALSLLFFENVRSVNDQVQELHFASLW